MLGLLLVDHGSRRSDANAQLEEMARLVAGLRPQDLVGSCHMELAEPDIAAGFAGLVARGATRVVLLPYLLSDGRHLSEDIPRLAGAAAANHPGVGFALGAALGPHQALARLLLERAAL